MAKQNLERLKITGKSSWLFLILGEGTAKNVYKETNETESNLYAYRGL